VRLQAVCYRLLEPVYASNPTSGEGARIHGGRFNPKGTPALYLARSVRTAGLEAAHGFKGRVEPLTLCSYDVDVRDVVDLTTAASRSAAGVKTRELNCAWRYDMSIGVDPPLGKLCESLWLMELPEYWSLPMPAEPAAMTTIWFCGNGVAAFRTGCAPSTRRAACPEISYPGANAAPAATRGRRTTSKSQSPRGTSRGRSRRPASDGWAVLAASISMAPCVAPSPSRLSAGLKTARPDNEA
jgi:hypothetical protein